ncbi:MAG: hypothetical protein WB697_02375, partial [Stellaceae bacterium]
PNAQAMQWRNAILEAVERGEIELSIKSWYKVQNMSANPWQYFVDQSYFRKKRQPAGLRRKNWC